MAEKEKRKGRRAYLDDFEKDESGKYVYKGKKFYWQNKRRTSLIKIWALCAAVFAAELIAGCFPGVGMNDRAWVIIPYMAALVCSVTLLWAAYQLTDGGDPLPEYMYDRSIKRFPTRGILTAVFSGAAILSELVNLLMKDKFYGKIFTAVVYLFLQAAALAAAVLLRRYILGLQWKTDDGQKDPDG